MEFIYELRDTTDEEMYFLLGIFDSLEAAQAEIESCKPYMKERETVLDCIIRNRKDMTQAVAMTAKVMREKEAVTVERDALNARVEELEQYNLDYAVREQELTTERDVLKVDVCKRCNGTGYEGGNVAGGYYCPACNGKGY